MALRIVANGEWVAWNRDDVKIFNIFDIRGRLDSLGEISNHLSHELKEYIPNPDCCNHIPEEQLLSYLPLSDATGCKDGGCGLRASNKYGKAPASATFSVHSSAEDMSFSGPSFPPKN